MLTFNGRNIISGYIKQLLHSFNLPVCKVFTDVASCKQYFLHTQTNPGVTRSSNAGYSMIAIIRNYKNNEDWFVKVDDKTNITPLYQYRYAHFYPNLTKVLRLENDIYDSYTHMYLGDYLRFIRDYHNINLLSLYNCFANEVIIRNNHKYLLIPVKYDKTYSVFTRLTHINYILTDRVKDADSIIYFNNPITASKSLNPNCIIVNVPPASAESVDVNNSTISLRYGKLYKEHYLKMIIEVPLNDDSPITVLEGDYRNYKPYFSNIQINYEKDSSNTYRHQNEYNELFNDNIGSNNFQLVNVLTNGDVSYPIADRLIEYLIGNVITEKDPISKNIIDAKKKLGYRYLGYNQMELNRTNASFTIMDRFKMLDAVTTNETYRLDDQDLLGYVDKDIEGVLDDERYVGGKVVR